MSFPLLGMCLFFALGLACGQILMKLAAVSVQSRAGHSLAQAALSPPLIGALVFYALITGLWIFILTRLPLSRAYPFSLFGSALVPFFAYMLLGEPLSARYIAGLGLVIGGLFILYV